MKNLFNISDLSEEEILKILNHVESKKILENKNIGLIFEKYSTRTRLSFSVGISHLGGNAIDIKFNELNISREESFEDTFRAMNCYLDGLIYRTNNHNKLLEASKYFEKPIVNALSDKSHPCQILSDLLTIKNHFNTLKIHILWMGDMNNVCFSLVEAVNLINDLNLTICTPKEISGNLSKSWKISNKIKIINKIDQIDLSQIKCVMTDVFVSMNDVSSDSKLSLLKPFSVNNDLISSASEDCIFMHCLPAKVGQEVTEDVFRSNKSIVWKQAENRMHCQKKLLSHIYSN